jgi:exportin-2 (importin alpha re-exporter)
VPALARLLSAMIARDAQHIVADNQLEPILGIWQRLISVKAHENYSFELIEAIITYIPAQTLEPYFVNIIQLMLQRLSNMKTENFQQRFIAFYHFVSARQDKGLGTDFFVQVADQVQHE